MKYILFVFSLILLSGIAPAQEIVYTQPDRQDNKSMDFDIIGKVGGNYLVFKNVRNTYDISVYNYQMDEVGRVPMEFLDNRTLNVDFVAYPDFAWMIYQYQQKNVIYCNAVKIDGNGKLLTDPIILDTSEVRFSAKNKIYTTVASEDKSQVMIFKIRREDGFFNFTNILFDANMNFIYKSKTSTEYKEKNHVFSDFILSDDGNFVFTVGTRSNTRDYISDLSLVSKSPHSDTFETMMIDLNDKFIDEIKLKIDNLNKHYILNSFYYLTRRGNTEGLFTAVINADNQKIISRTFAQMSDDLKSNLKTKGGKKTALNNFFIRNVILKNDGGFLLMAEDFYNESRYSPWNRWDYMYGYGYSPFYSPFYSYSPYYSPFYYGNRGYNDVRFYYNNILVLSLDSAGRYDWTTVINKSQFDDQSDNNLSYALMITGGRLHFLYNELARRKQILTERTIDGKGDIERNPPMHNLDRGYTFMPRYAKQVSASEIIIPCMYRNNICFARVQF